MALRAPIRLATVATILLLLCAAAIWVQGPAGTFSMARGAERVRNGIDAVDILERDVGGIESAFRTVLLVADSAALRDYRERLSFRDARLDSLRSAKNLDPEMVTQLAGVRAAFAELDAERLPILDRRGNPPDGSRALITADAMSGAHRRATATLSSLETSLRGKLAVAQPILERRRDWLLLAIPASLGAAMLLLFWLYRELRASVAEASNAARYRLLLDESPDGIMVHNRGRVIYANAQAAQLFGATDPSQLVGRQAIDLIYPGDREAVASRVDDVVERGLRPPPRLTRLNRLDGAVLEVETRSAPIAYEGERAAEVVMRDVSERRRGEIALATSEQRFRAVLETMEEGVCLQDEHLTIRLWNPAAERILGLSGDQMAGKTSYDPDWRAVDEFGDDLPGERHVAPVALRTGRPASGIMGVSRADGTRVWIQVSAVPMIRENESVPYAVVVTFADVTLARLNAKALKDSEARYRLITENSGDLVTLRSADDTLLYVSPSHERVTGWTPEELLGKPGSALVHPDDLMKLERAPDARFSGDGARNTTLRVKHKDGHWIWLEVVAAPIAAGDGAFSTFVTSARDISDRRRLEEELLQAQKMESMGRMASGVAHDFNNLLTAIRSSAELLLHAPLGRDMVRESVTEITEAVDRAAALTAQLLAFARRQHTQPALLDCAQVLRDARGLLARLAAPTSTVTMAIADDVESATIFADRSQFEQVLFNLVVNARDASTRDGEVTIELGSTYFAEEMPGRFGNIGAGRYVTLCVRDNGAGIPTGVMPHLFEPFFTTKPQGAGTGLGLSTVYGIVNQHNGGVAVASEAGVGSEFTVYWPRTDAADELTDSQPCAIAPEPALDNITPVVERAGPVRSTVLLVDDEPSVRRTVAKLLGRCGLNVVQAANGADAIAIIRDGVTRIDALVTDVKMPGMTGVQLVEELLRLHVDLPVLFISGQIDDPIPREWPTGSPRHFLRKPFRGGELSQKVLRLIPEASRSRGVITV